MKPVMPARRKKRQSRCMQSTVPTAISSPKPVTRTSYKIMSIYAFGKACYFKLGGEIGISIYTAFAIICNSFRRLSLLLLDCGIYMRFVLNNLTITFCYMMIKINMFENLKTKISIIIKYQSVIRVVLEILFERGSNNET